MNDKITICSVGDLMICDSPLYASVGVGSKYPKIKGNLFCNCKEIFESADVVIGNFETVVHTPQNKSLKENQMCCSEEVIKEISDAGFSVLNLANNHCMQHGVEGFNNTRQTCNKFGVQPIGIRDENPYIKVVRDRKVAFLSLCIHLEWYEPEHILYEDRLERIIEEVQRLRSNERDIIIVVTAHWGDEFASYPSNAQIAFAHRLVENGANIILGHHSHVYQGIEEYTDGLIVYGQGNFISDMVPEMCRQTGIIRIVIDKDDKITYELLPYYIGDDYIPDIADKRWVEERQRCLQIAVKGDKTDDDYWNDIYQSHRKAHNDFRQFFRRNICKYSFRISIKMIWEFIGRKIKRIIGISSDGKVSSMNQEILSILEKTLN